MILCDHFSCFTQVTVSKRPLWKTHQKGHLGDVLDNRNRSLGYVKRSLKKTLRVNHGTSGLKIGGYQMVSPEARIAKEQKCLQFRPKVTRK